MLKAQSPINYLLVLMVFVSMFSSVSAGTGTTITRGDPATISWDVSSGSCIADWQTGDAASMGAVPFTNWNGSFRSGTASYTFQTTPTGDAFNIPGTFVARCTAGAANDTAQIIVNDCPVGHPGTTWNGGSNSCTCDNYPAGGNSPTCNVCPGGYTWTNDGSNGGTGSCQPSSCGNGAIDPPTCTPPPTVTLNADSTYISYNNNANLTWTPGSSPTSCTATGGTFAGSKSTAGGTQSTGNLTATTTYTIYCSNAGGNSSTQTVTVQVCPSSAPTRSGGACIVGPSAPTVNLTANNYNLSYNTATVLNWNTSNSPTSCTATGDWVTTGAKNIAGGSESTGNLTSSVNNYTIVCTNAQGSATSSIVINVCTGGTPNWNSGSNACEPVPSGTATTTGSGTGGICTIPLGGSKCGSDITWSVTYPVVSTSSLTSTASGLLSTLNSGTLTNVLNATGTNVNTYTLKHNSVTLTTMTVTSVCALNTHWDNPTEKCVLDPSSGNITASPNPCIILVGDSSCQTNIQWTTTNAANVSVIQDSTPFSSALNNSSPTLNATINYDAINPTTFYLKDADTLVTLSQVDVTAVCENGSSWDVATGKCKASPSAGVCNISAVGNCVIPFNGSTCTTNIAWDQTGANDPNIKRNGSNVRLDSGPAGVSSGQFSTVPLTWGDVASYTCYDNLTTIGGPVTVNIICSPGSSWDAGSNKCVPIPPILTASTTGNTTINNTWDCISPAAQSVSLYREISGVPASGLTVVIPSNTSSGRIDSSLTPNTQYDYTLTCYDGVNGTGSVTGVATAQATTFNDTITITTCPNGALVSSAPACDQCPAGQIFDGIRCSLMGPGLYCGQTATGLTCGNARVDSGEACDGVVGLVDTGVQKCSADCLSILCKDSTSTSTTCGLISNPGGVDNQVCTNGAVQTSSGDSPTQCAVCPYGESYATSTNSCIKPVCGNGVKESPESCDDLDASGVSLSGTCTNGCCTTVAATSTSCFPTYDLGASCSAGTPFSLTKGGTVIIATTTAATLSWTAATSGTYSFNCIHPAGVNTVLIPLSGVCTFSSNPIKLYSSSKSIIPGGTTVLSWIIDTPISTCRITASPTITAPTATCDSLCVLARKREADNLTFQQLANGVTSAGDPYGAGRNMTAALTTAASSGKAQGQKSLKLKYSTIFEASCALNTKLDPNKVKVYVDVGKTNDR